jgi:solute carrier family 35 protein E3
MHFFERAIQFPTSQRVILACASVGSIIFMNFNLKMNSVGFYQLSKLLCIPAIVVYNFMFEHKSTSTNILITLTVLLIGIGLFTVNDVQVNLPGTLIALLAVGFVAVSQTKTGTVQKEYAIGGFAAQHATAFYQFVISLQSALLMETNGKGSVLSHAFQKPEIIVIIMTGFVSVSVNVFTFALIGKTSPVTYQVVGHCKTILIFVIGLILFPAHQGETKAQFIKKMIGLVVSMTGMIADTHFKLKENQPRTGDGETLLHEKETTNDMAEQDENDK